MGEVRQAPGSGTRLVGMWKVCNVLMSLFFALAAYVQINDPDAGLWMVGYGVPAVLCAGIGWKPQVTEQVFVLKAPPGGCVVSVQLSAEQLITDQCTVTVVVAETLPWRRVADLHVMTSAAAAAALGWALREEPVTHILQQEQGREFSGLMLTLVWLLLCRHSGRAPVGMLRVSTAAAITVFPLVAWLYYHINKELRVNWPSHCKTAI
ncbi:transmembrane protein 220 isoform X2 [Trachinotus anak]|uniref:transmembrane protein 220 isoform X2 n=1 Tax=Trachinotus anak TaxID=443729 RepID=UPI0039F1C642